MNKNTYELEARYTSRKSFYKKARVTVYEDGTKVLTSYGTDVLKLRNDGTIQKLWNGYTATTGRHIHEFLLQECGEGIGKSTWEKMDCIHGYTIKGGTK